MKKWIVIIILFGLLIATIVAMSSVISHQRDTIDKSLQKIAAYSSEADSLNKQCKLFQFHILEVTNSNDSLLKKMYSQARELKIKDKQIEGLQYKLEHFEKTDTLFVRDTIFKEPTFVLDTCFSDKWSQMCLHLEYPNKVGMSASFDNESHAVIYWKKVPVKPRKCKFAEWFTRKRKEIVVEVHTDNPYVETKTQRFVQIVK